MDVLSVTSIDGIEKIFHVFSQVDIASIGSQRDLFDGLAFAKLFDDVSVLARKVLVDIENVHVNNERSKKSTSRRRC